MARRILRDYKQLIQGGPENGIWIKTTTGTSLKQGDDMSKFYIMIRGPEGPYEGALFFFTLEPFTQYVPANDGKSYPVHPPKVLHMSPFSFRAHPNLYQGYNAKVCLSILGTWAGPSWTPMMSFMTICQTILSILDNSPLQNEPGYANRPEDPKVSNYTKHVQFACMFETITKTFIPVLANKTHKNSVEHLFKDEITAIWIQEGSSYIQKMKQLQAEHNGQLVPESAYGPGTFSKIRYDFTPALNALSPYIRDAIDK